MSGITDAVLGRLGFNGNSAKVSITDSSGNDLGVAARGVPTVDANIIPLGYAGSGASGLATVKSLAQIYGGSIPAGATLAVLQCKVTGEKILWRDDGVDPATAGGLGMEILPGDQYLYTGDLTAIRFIGIDGTSVLNVSVYKQG